MNQIQLISRNILCNRLKLQLGLDQEVDIEPRTLQAMWRQLRDERTAELARVEASWSGLDKNRAA